MSRYVTFTASSVLVGLFVLFVILRLVTPSDGARLEPGVNALSAEGISLTPLRADPRGVRDGDLVTAAEGISLEEWANDLFRRELPRPDWRKGDTAAYDVLRAEVERALDQPLGAYPLWAVFRNDWGALVFALANLLVALFAFSRRPDDAAVRVLLLGAASMLAASTWSLGMQVSDFVFPLGMLLYQGTTIFAFSLVWVCLLHFVLVFPRPQPWLAGRRWALPLLYIAPFAFLGAWLIISRLTAESTLVWLAGFGLPTGVVQVVYMLLTLVAAFFAVRYARDPVSRAQVRWVLFALVAALAFALLFSEIPALLLGEHFISPKGVAVFGLILPISIVIAIFRYRLFNIDIIIRRTTQYAIVSVVLALIYFASVVALQWLFSSITGQSSTIAVVLSTLLIAALFLPLRQRVQDVVDRRFYRTHYDAQRTLEQFAQTVRDETDLDALTAELVRVIEETMQPEFVSVWLRPVESAGPDWREEATTNT